MLSIIANFQLNVILKCNVIVLAEVYALKYRNYCTFGNSEYVVIRFKAYVLSDIIE